MNNNSLYEIFDNGGVRVALIGALSILALFLLAETISIAANFGRSGVPATDTITVQGDGQATMPPDVARISFTVDNTSATVAQAQEATTKQANTALDFVKGQGVAEKDIKTLSYNISPQYSYPNPCAYGAICPDYYRAPKITGYQVSETIQVTMRDLTKVGELLGGLGKLEVQNVNGPAFALDDSTAGYGAARADAINKAKTQGELLAKQLGVKLGKIVNFSESSGGYQYPMMAYGLGGASEKSAVPDVPVGENTYNASVSITYEIR
ncbi:MAG: SIMPL domain-containing protein [bacterium]|nr:SIMPL domain-containing protein [bacterium]